MSGITTISGRPAVICSAWPWVVQSAAPPTVPWNRYRTGYRRCGDDAYPRGSSTRTRAGPGSADVRTVSAISRESSRCVDATRMPSAARNRSALAADGNSVTAP